MIHYKTTDFNLTVDKYKHGVKMKYGFILNRVLWEWAILISMVTVTVLIGGILFWMEAQHFTGSLAIFLYLKI